MKIVFFFALYTELQLHGGGWVFVFFLPFADSKETIFIVDSSEKSTRCHWEKESDRVLVWCSKRWNWLTYLSLQYYLDNSWAMCHPFDNGVVEYPNFLPNTLMQPFCEFHPENNFWHEQKSEKWNENHWLRDRKREKEVKTEKRKRNNFKQRQNFRISHRKAEPSHIIYGSNFEMIWENKGHQFAISHYIRRIRSGMKKKIGSRAHATIAVFIYFASKTRFSFHVVSACNEWAIPYNIVDILNWHLFSSLNLTKSNSLNNFLRLSPL